MEGSLIKRDQLEVTQVQKSSAFKQMSADCGVGAKPSCFGLQIKFYWTMDMLMPFHTVSGGFSS